MAAILAIHAHPDDIETLSAGTLALLSGAGHRVTIVTVTAGEGGSTDYTPEETGRIRQAEGKAAAAVIDADYWCIGIPDLAVFNDDPTRRAVTEAIRRAAPDIVLGPSPVDYHPDHEAVAILVRDACFASSVPNYRTGPSTVLPAIPHLYMMDPIGGRDRDGARITPEFGADITTALDAKRRMLAQHVSQDAWVAKQHDISDHLSSMEKWSRRRGRDFGVEAGEGFRQYRHHPYPTTGLLQELLGGWLARPTASA
jgi:LmbE family N-acetylglucosaminyl deacetylase